MDDQSVDRADGNLRERFDAITDDAPEARLATAAAGFGAWTGTTFGHRGEVVGRAVGILRSQVVGHREAATIHITTAAYHCGQAVERLKAEAIAEAAYHAGMACANMAFAAHHAGEAVRPADGPIGDTAAALRSHPDAIMA